MLGQRRIGAIFYFIANVDRTEAFYRDVIGLSVHRTKGEPGQPDMLTASTAGGVDLLFFPGEPRPGNSPIPVFELDQGGIDAVVDSLVRAGATLVTPVSEAPGGWSAEIADPDGYQISMFQSADKQR